MSSFRLFGVLLFKPDFLCQKYLEINATAMKEMPKGELPFLTRNRKRKFVSKAKNLMRICVVEKLKSFMDAAKCFHLGTASSNER